MKSFDSQLARFGQGSRLLPEPAAMPERGSSSRQDAILAAAAAGFFLLCSAWNLGAPGLDCNESAEAAEAVIFLKRLFGLATAGPTDLVYWAFGRFPWMHEYHIGAIKTYCLAGAFALFGPGPIALRSVTLAFGAAAVFFSTLLAAKVYGRGWAAALGLWLGSDPFLVVMARHDFGPCIVSIGLKCAGLYCLYSGAVARRRWPCFLGGLLLGLCVWDKAHSAWVLAALVFAGLFLPVSYRKHRSLILAGIAGAGVGICPLVVFNIVYPLRTLSFPPFWGLGRHSSVLGDFMLRAGYIAEYLKRGFLEGLGPAHVVAGDGMARQPAWIRFRLLPLLAACAALVPICVRTASERRRAAGFWLAVSSGICLAACLTPAYVAMSHMGTLYPFPHWLLLSVAAGAAGAVPKRRWLLSGLGILLAAAVVGNLFLLGDFYTQLRLSGGEGPWYVGIEELARRCLDHPGPVVALDYSLSDPLTVYLGFKKSLEQAPPEPPSPQRGPLDPGRLRIGSLARGTWLVVYELTTPSYPDGAPYAAAARRDPRLSEVASIPYSDGRSWAGIYVVR